jgi:hypothetical protein
MSGRGSQWKLGCGIGCGVLLLLVIVVVIGSIYLARTSVHEFDTAITMREDLEARFGATQDFTPSADGSIPPARMEAFLSVRDSLHAASQEIATTFLTLARIDTSGRKSPARAFKLLKLGFFQARNHALLDAGMGLGEYTYIYAIAYYDWLGKSPGDGPENTQIAWDDNGEGFSVQTDQETEHVRTAGARRSIQRICGDLKVMLRNQLSALAGPDSSSLAAGWPRQLADEIARMDQDLARLPWQDDLPAAIAASLDPYRRRLEATYNPATNLFELSINHKKHLGIQAD